MSISCVKYCPYHSNMYWMTKFYPVWSITVTPLCFKTIFIVDVLINLFEARDENLDLMFKGNAVILNCKKYVDCTQLLIIVDFIV